MQNLEDFRTLWNNQLESYFESLFQKANESEFYQNSDDGNKANKNPGPRMTMTIFLIGFWSCFCDWDAPETVSVISETFDFLLGILEI